MFSLVCSSKTICITQNIRTVYQQLCYQWSFWPVLVVKFWGGVIYMQIFGCMVGQHPLPPHCSRISCVCVCVCRYVSIFLMHFMEAYVFIFWLSWDISFKTHFLPPKVNHFLFNELWFLNSMYYWIIQCQII